MVEVAQGTRPSLFRKRSAPPAQGGQGATIKIVAAYLFVARALHQQLPARSGKGYCRLLGLNA
jgi:hypothetical protein